MRLPLAETIAAMSVRVRPCLLALLLAGLPSGVALAQWDTFHGDNQRTGQAAVNFPSGNLQVLWKFTLGEHTWRYCKGASVWSASPVFGEVGGRTLVFIGAYDNNLYALEAVTGKVVWRFTTGCVINAAPVFAVVEGRPRVFVASTDRTFYCVDAATGSQLWAYETVPWTYTVGHSQPSSPLVTTLDGQQVVFIAFWNTDRRPVRAVQKGELLAFRADRRELLWRIQLSDSNLSTPSLLEVDGRAMLFLGSEDGQVRAVEARTGKQVWAQVTGHAIVASPLALKVAGQPVVYVGDWFGMVYCLSARDGRLLWSYKTGHAINSTAASAPVKGRPTIFIGSQDRSLHAIDARSSAGRWRFPTKKYIVSSPAIAAVEGKPAVFFSSLDNYLYAVDAATGSLVWRFQTGSMLWPYETRGASLWSSPAVAEVAGVPLLAFGGHDGYLYAFTARPGAAAAPSKTGPTLHRPGAAVLLPPLVGLLFLLAGAMALLRYRKPQASADLPSSVTSDNQ